MEGIDGRIQSIRIYGTNRTVDIFEHLRKNRLWQRQLKNIITTTIVVSICLVPKSSRALGRAAYLGAITTVFAHPGRRFGELVETLTLAISGTLLGLCWSLLGLYLSSLVIQANPAAAYSVRGVFLTCALIFHGFLRSKTPRLFVFVLLLVIVSVVSMTSVATSVTSLSVTQILYPILVATGVILAVNLCILPEFSANFLGETTIDTLYDTADSLRHAGRYFTEASRPAGASDCPSTHERGAKTEGNSEDTEKPDQRSPTLKFFRRIFGSKSEMPQDDASVKELHQVTLQELVGAKARLRSNLARCKKAQSECNFEVAFAVLPPRSLKPISSDSMKRLVANAIAVVGACESKFALLGEVDEQDHDICKDFKQPQPGSTLGQNPVNYLKDRRESRKPVSGETPEPAIESEKTELDLIKPRREIEFGDVRLLQYLLQRIAEPYTKLSTVISRAIDCTMVSIAYTYGVAKLPSGAKVPKGLSIEEVDLHTDELSQALITFDVDIAAALDEAVELQESDARQLDIMPREEIFLVASFILNLRQAASHIEEMLKHSRSLVLQAEARHGRRRFYAPRIKWSKWLYSGGEEDEALPATGRKPNRKGEEDEKADDEDDADHPDFKETLIKPLARAKDLETGKGTGVDPPRLAGRLSTSQSRSLQIRGKLADVLEWAQTSDDLLYAFKLAVAVMMVTWPAFVARWNTWYSLNRGLWAALQLVFITEVSIGNSIMMFLLRGIGTTLGCFWGWAALEAGNGNRIVVAAMVCIGLIPSTYVQLGSKYPKAGSSATENFLKRWLAFFFGGIVALIVEVGFLPVKARTRLVESLASVIRQIREMETCIAVGIEEGVNVNIYDPQRLKRFERASGKVNGALAAAETFLPFCSNEPRIKGSFEGLSLIYGEILFVLHQIVDRMDNMLQLRTAYGSGPLEEFNAQLYPYRRNVAGAITLTLFAVETSLDTKTSLPQFFPSARLAHLRMIKRVRELVQQAMDQDPKDNTGDPVRQRAVRRKYMAWNAASAARVEITEYLEELIDLAKLVVGANEFRSGLLMRTTYQDYAQRPADVASKSKEGEGAVDTGSEGRDNFAETRIQPSGFIRRRRLTTIQSSGSAEDKVPASLQRIQSRKTEAAMKRQAADQGWT